MGTKDPVSTISPEIFSGLMSSLPLSFDGVRDIAVAVSGGGDSLALAILLSEWVSDKSIRLHALTVDHGLRPEAADEAKYVGVVMKALGVSHRTLLWEGSKPKSGIQEAAREARYMLMTDYCRRKKIKYLFVAHHGQDQIETILFRMSKGTGVDGLIGMRPVQELDGGLVLVRPLLTCSHEELLGTCQDAKIDWIEDPSNQNERYARVRIRNILDVLEREGLTPERMDSLSRRVQSSLQLIDYLIENQYNSIIISKDTLRIEIKYSEVLRLPFEGKVRILRRLIDDMGQGKRQKKKYPVRLEDVERLAARLDEKFRGATLAGCQFKRQKESLVVVPENA